MLLRRRVRDAATGGEREDRRQDEARVEHLGADGLPQRVRRDGDGYHLGAVGQRQPLGEHARLVDHRHPVDAGRLVEDGDGHAHAHEREEAEGHEQRRQDERLRADAPQKLALEHDPDVTQRGVLGHFGFRTFRISDVGAQFIAPGANGRCGGRRGVPWHARRGGQRTNRASRESPTSAFPLPHSDFRRRRGRRSR